MVGSSLMVYSAFRLAKAAKDAGAAVVLVSVGPNRADSLADCKARCTGPRAPSGVAQIAHLGFDTEAARNYYCPTIYTVWFHGLTSLHAIWRMHSMCVLPSAVGKCYSAFMCTRLTVTVRRIAPDM